MWLSTGPEHPATHWYQCRLLLREPLAVNATQTVSGVLRFKANKRLSYDITFDAFLDGTHITSKNTIQLHNQMYHCEHATPSPSKRSPRSRDASLAPLARKQISTTGAVPRPGLPRKTGQATRKPTPMALWPSAPQSDRGKDLAPRPPRGPTFGVFASRDFHTTCASARSTTDTRRSQARGARLRRDHHQVVLRRHHLAQRRREVRERGRRRRGRRRRHRGDVDRQPARRRNSRPT